MALPLLALGIGAGALQTLIGMNKQRNTTLPLRTVNPYIAQNQALAQNMANVGLGRQQYNNTLNQNRQNLSSVLASLSRSGRNFNTAGLLRQANQATQNLNMLDEQARLKNIQNLFQQNQVLANEQANVRAWNIEQPYLQRRQENNNLINSGLNNIFGGLGAMANMNMLQGLYGGNQKSPANTNMLAPINNQVRLGAGIGLNKSLKL